MERPTVECGLLQEGHHRHDAVISAKVVVEPELIDEGVTVFLKKLSSIVTCAGDPRRRGRALRSSMARMIGVGPGMNWCAYTSCLVNGIWKARP
ncbi:hypothetical protein HDA42_000151 [Streptomyces costaricanus]|uniref:Uncharacterized protein n=1 Tax=Streptomyces murinus TaxID=33900 RepID=A0A7W3NI64_STRMR|nr:hypothetical protein [Streptomyces murinus]